MIALLALLALADPVAAPPQYRPPSPLGPTLPVVTQDGVPLPTPPIADWHAEARLADGTPLPDFDRGRIDANRKRRDVVATVVGSAVVVGLAAPIVYSIVEPGVQ